MHLFYSVFIHFYGLFMRFASIFNKKAEEWWLVRKNWYAGLSDKTIKNNSYYWIHCASAGEFEQAIPLIQKLKNHSTDYKTAVSFYSSSGYEMYKNSDYADLFFYFPLDTHQNALKLVEILQPKFVIIIRNEIWLNVLRILQENQIPVFLVNANPEQKRNFFYQTYLNHAYPLFTKIFDTNTFGTTKLEKVISNKNIMSRDVILEDFCKNSFVITLGSSWPAEEKMLAEFYKRNKTKIPNLKIIIAPHEFDEIKKIELEKLFDEIIKSYTKYEMSSTVYSILFLDKKGILKYTYRYADIAVIGGGFNKGVHNITEAAIYGIPTVFGKNYFKSEEVNELVNAQLAFPVNNIKELENKMKEYFEDKALRQSLKEKLNNYFSIQENVSDKIIHEILKQTELKS